MRLLALLPPLSLLALLALLATSVADARGADTPAAGAPRGVVLIISDDQAWTDYGFMGHEAIRTPHLDRLAAESLTFTRGYVPTSLCRASLMTILTGLYPHQHKIGGNDPRRGVDRRLLEKHVQNVPTLPRLLGERGYLSHQSGKWWEGNPRLGGFTHGMTHGDPARGGRHGDLGLTIGRQGLAPIEKFLDECGDRPFLLWYAPFLPHTPHNPPERLLEKYTQPGRSPFVAKYYAMCEWFDETCGQLLDVLAKRGLANDTLVVYVTDNGWIQNENAGNFAPRSKRSPNEGGVRTPIMLRWPGQIEPRRDDTTLVSSIDLAPTILAACGVQRPASLPGVDLLATDAPQRLAQRPVYGALFDHDQADVDSPDSSLLYRWVIAGQLKLIEPQGRPEAAEVYDLGADPHEEIDIAEKQPDDVVRLRKLLDAWWRPAAQGS